MCGAQGWGMYAALLTDLFKFLAPFLRNTELGAPVARLYRGTLRVLLVLLHDFPEFLCDHSYTFCDEIPPNCIQMRNLILSAFPRTMRLPDPFTPNLKVDLLPEIALPPRAARDAAALLPPSRLRRDLDVYLEARAPVTFLAELRTNLQVAREGAGGGEGAAPRYEARLVNAVVAYVGARAVAELRARGLAPSLGTVAHSAHMDVFHNFIVDFDHEGRSAPPPFI